MAVSRPKTSSKWKWLFGILSIAVAVALLATLGVLLQFYSFEIVGAEVPLVLGFVGAVSCVAVTWLLDRDDRVARRFTKGRYNLKWFAIVPLALSFDVATFLVYLSRSGTSLGELVNIDFGVQASQNLLFFTVTSMFATLAGLLAYFGLKNVNPNTPIQVPKFASFGALVLLFMILTAGAGYLVHVLVTYPPASVGEAYAHDDGPWVTWSSDDPTSEACVSWLTKAPGDTVLMLGLASDQMTEEWTGKGGVYLHKVYLKGLKPDTTYYYSIPEVNFEQDHPESFFSFRTAPSTARPFKFIVVGDMQPCREALFESNRLVVSGILNETSDFVCQVGDACDSGGTKEEWHYLFNSLS
ncbi:MAG: fibronectin type III domain-containing protein, partial [Promethearchaeota archaeon]